MVIPPDWLPPGADPFGLDRATQFTNLRVPRGELLDVVVLDRVDQLDREDAPYCIHGQVTCARCRAWCWLGDKTHDMVHTGRTQPLCKPCADKHLPPDHPTAGNAGDHRRDDGPH